MNVVASLEQSADRFRALGRTFDAVFTADMARDAREWPEMYRHWAVQQARRVVDLSALHVNEIPLWDGPADLDPFYERTDDE